LAFWAGDHTVIEPVLVADPSPMLDWLTRYQLEARLTLRMSAAGLITFAVAQLLDLARDYWAVLTAVIVMQASVGGSLKAMVDRFLGTIGGAAWGAAVTSVLPHVNLLSTGVALAVALVPLASLVAFRPTFRVAPVTAVIVLLGAPDQYGVLHTALERVFEIGLGSIIALAVALLISPTRAHGMARVAARDALAAMGEQVRNLLADITTLSDDATTLALHDRTRTAIERVAAAAAEAQRERRSYLSVMPDPDPVVRTLRRMSHDLIMVARAVATSLPEAVERRLAGAVSAAAAALSDILAEIGDSLASASPPPDMARLHQTLTAFGAEFAALRSDGILRALPDEAVERVFGFAFALEQIGRHLDELADRVREIAASR
jgi:uncharacterized membrane protein YccC